MARVINMVKVGGSDDEWLAELIKDGTADVQIVIPDDLTYKEVMSGIDRCTSSLDKLGRIGNVLGVMLGRYMALVAKRPEIFRKAGYDSLLDFENAKIIDKIGHGTLWDYKKISEAFPTMPLREFQTIRKGNLLDASKVLEGKSESQVTEIVAKAKELPNKAFREWLVEESHTGKGELQGSSLLVSGNHAEIEELKGLLNDPRCRRFYCEDGGDPNKVRHIDQLLCALKESTTEWPPEEQLEIPPHAPDSEQPAGMSCGPADKGDGW